MLLWRLLLGVLIVAALIGLIWLDHHAVAPGLWLLPAVITVAALAGKELLDLAARANLHPLRWTVYCGNVLLIVSSWLWMLDAIPRGSWRHEWSNPTVLGVAAPPGILTALAISSLIVLLAEAGRYRQPGGNTANLAVGVFALVYIGLMLAFAVYMRLYFGVGALAAWLITVKMGDTGAYAAGYWLGRHKLAPLLSPGKTVEGAVGCLVSSCLGAWLTMRFIIPCTTPTWVNPAPWWGWIAFGLLVGGAGMLGDLFESMLKRDVGVKDSSTWLPGFGGVLDMVDSLLLSAPVAWFCWAAGLAGR